MLSQQPDYAAVYLLWRSSWLSVTAGSSNRRAREPVTPPRCIIEVSLVFSGGACAQYCPIRGGIKDASAGTMFSRSLSVCVTLCLWITALMSAGSVCAKKQDDSFFTASIYRARCASRCLSLHITRISAFFKHSQVREHAATDSPTSGNALENH